MRTFMSLAAFVLLVAACGGNGTSTESSTTVASSTTGIVSTTAAPSTTVVDETTSTTTIAPTESLGVDLLVAGPSGVTLLGADGSQETLVSSPAVFAIDDLNGGILFQLERWSRGGASRVYRVPSGGSEAIETLVAAGDQGLVLNGIAVDGDDTFVYYTRIEGTTPDDARDTLRRYNLATREVTELGQVGGWEAGAFPISISDTLVLTNWSAEVYHGMDFTDLAGNAAAVAADPDPADSAFADCGECPRVGELSQDGRRLVYTETATGVTYAVIRHVATGAEIRRIELGTSIDFWVTSFDLNVDHLVVNRESSAGVLDAWIYDLDLVDPEPMPLGIAGEAYLARSAVEIDGPVTAP